MDAVIACRPSAISDSTDLIALALQDILLSLDLPSKIITFEEYDEYTGEPDIWFFVGNSTFFRAMKTGPRPGLKIVLNHERLPHMSGDRIEGCVRVRNLDVPKEMLIKFRRNWGRLNRCAIQPGFADWVFDYNPHNCQFLRSNGIRCVFVPVAWHERFILGVNAGRKDGISFFGRFRTPHRKIAKWRVENVTGVPVIQPRKSHLRAVMAEYQVGLHLHYFNGYSIFPDRRIAIMAASGCSIVSERCDWTPFDDDDWIECPYEEIPGQCKVALSGSGSNAENFYRTKFRYEDYVKNALEVVGVI